MMRGRGRRNAGTPRRFPQRKSLRALIGQDGLGRGDQRLLQIAVMIAGFRARRGSAWRQRPGLLSSA